MTFADAEIQTAVLALQENLLLLEAHAYKAKGKKFTQHASKCRQRAAELCHKQNKIWQAVEEEDSQ